MGTEKDRFVSLAGQIAAGFASKYELYDYSTDELIESPFPSHIAHAATLVALAILDKADDYYGEK